MCVCRPEAISQLGFIAEKILSRKHQEFMEQISNVTTSLQESLEESHYKNEHSSYNNLEREKAKTTETAEDLLQSFAISSSTVSKKVPPKLVKPSRTEAPHNVTKEKEGTLKHSTTTKSVDQDTVSITKPKREVKPLKHHRFVISSSEESDGEQAIDDKVVNPSPPSTDNGRSFTAHLHAKIYPGIIEQAEVVWSDKTTLLGNVQADNISDAKHCRWSYTIHPAVPWVRRRSLYKTETADSVEPSDNTTADDNEVKDNTPTDTVTPSDKLTPSDDDGPSDKNAAENKDFEEDNNVTETESRHSSRLRKRKLGHLPSSDSEGERTPTVAQKKFKLDTPPPIDEANEPPDAHTPTGTRSSKRVRRAPVKLRQ